VTVHVSALTAVVQPPKPTRRTSVGPVTVSEIAIGYQNARERLSDLVRGLSDEDLHRTVPACPAWDVHDVIAHMSGVQELLTGGERPTGDTQAWIDAIVAARRDIPVGELLDRWAACAPGTSAIIEAGVPVLIVDVVSHEHDIRNAVGSTGARKAPEVPAAVEVMLTALSGLIDEAGLGALAVDTGTARWTSHDAPTGCTLEVDPWEALRIIVSRRTDEEMRTVTVTGDIEPYIRLLDARSPLPRQSLGEH
jgi:uncharacterized protein (TIGR03083 family)